MKSFKSNISAPLLLLLALIAVQTVSTQTLSAAPTAPADAKASATATKSQPSSKRPAAKNSKSFELNEKGAQATSQKNFILAEELFRKSLSEDPGNVTAAFNLAGIYVANKKEDQAVALLNDYVQRFKKDPSLFARLADAHFALKNLTSAEENYRKVIELAPKYPGAQAKLATVYSLQNNTKLAEVHLVKAVEANPKDPQLLANLSAIFLANAKPEESVSAAKRALKIKSSAETYITLGSAYENLKDYKNSLISFERAQDLGSKSETLAKHIEELKKRAS